MSNRTRQNNKRADRNRESNDSPEILDRGETSEDPGLHSGPQTTAISQLIHVTEYREEGEIIYRYQYNHSVKEKGSKKVKHHQ